MSWTQMTFVAGATLPASQMNGLMGNFGMGAKIYLTSCIGITNNVQTLVNFHAVDRDTDNMWDANSPGALFVKSGSYSIVEATAMVRFLPGILGWRAAKISVNSDTTAARGAHAVYQTCSWASIYTELSLSTGPISVVSGDRISLFVHHVNGGDLGIRSADGLTFLAARIVG